MNCKGGCLASMGPDQPAEVVHDAPKTLVRMLNLFKHVQHIFLQLHGI